MSIKEKSAKFIPQFFLEYRRNWLDNIFVRQAHRKQRKALNKLRTYTNPINVVFFVHFESIWKCDELYSLFNNDTRFNPTILVCPITNYGLENMKTRMEECYHSLSSKGYRVIRAYDPNTSKSIDIRKQLNPHIIFFTNPYKDLTLKDFFIFKYPDVLTAYIPYFFTLWTNLKANYDTAFHNSLWKYYTEMAECKKFAESISRTHGRNIVHTGFPGIDTYINENDTVKNDPWKIKDRNIKRIIWAPHHTINHYSTLADFSTFLEYYDIILQFAVKYKNKIQIAFKPHPLLKNRLEIEWGKDKTQKYYSQWEALENGMTHEGLYQDLFKTSDAIMHDSGSFIAEYLFTGKPALHLRNDIPYEEKYNSIALKSLNHYYKADNAQDIENFIVNVINGVDPMKEERIRYVKENLMPPNNQTASKNIFDDIVMEIFGVKNQF